MPPLWRSIELACDRPLELSQSNAVPDGIAGLKPPNRRASGFVGRQSVGFLCNLAARNGVFLITDDYSANLHIASTRTFENEKGAR